MKTIQILITDGYDDDLIDDLSDMLDGVLSAYLSKWNYTVTVHDGVR
jgi:hypothetical protein